MTEIVNRRPSPGEDEVDGAQSIGFGFRAETRVELGSVLGYLMFLRVLYVGDEIPSRDPAIRRGEGYAYEGRFSDAALVPPTGMPATFSLEPEGLQIQKTTGSDQESFVFITDRLVPEGPICVEIEIEVLQHTAGAPAGTFSFYDQPNFTGVLLGLVNWRWKTGVFLLLMDDGVNKSFVVTGPAKNAAGERDILGSVPLDWSGGPAKFRLMWNDTPGQKNLQAIIEMAGQQNGNILELLDLLEGTNFVPDLRIGGISTSAPAHDTIMVVVGTAGPTSGDAIMIRSIAVGGFGIPLVVDGGPTPSAELIRAGNAADLLRVGEMGWAQEGDGGRTFEADGTNVVLRAEDGAGAFVAFSEPDLLDESWMYVVSFSVPQHTSTPGVPRTGPEFEVSDGTNLFVISCIDDGGTTKLGLLLGPGTSIDDFAAGDEVDWTGPTVLMLAGASATGLRVEVNDAPYAAVSPYQDFRADTTSETKLRVGWAAAAGRLHVSGFWAFPNALRAEPGEGTLPAAQGWTQTTADGATISLSSGRYLIDAATAGGRKFFSVAPANYEAQAAGAWHLRCRPLSWTDQYGAPSPTNVEVGPVALVQFDTNKYVGLSFVELEGGRLFAFIRGEDDDLRSVITRSARGTAISAEVSSVELTSYILEVVPGKHVRLYVNYQALPAIDLPWVDVVHRPSPSALPAGTAGAFGSVGEEGGVKLDVAFARFGYGRGYDFLATPRLTEEELRAWAYDGTGSVYAFAKDV